METRGRKSIYKANPDFYCTNFIEQSQGGLPQTEIIAEWKISPQTFYRWKKTHKEFSDAIGLGRMLARGWWMKRARMAALGVREKLKDGTSIQLSYKFFNWLMMNCFGIGKRNHNREAQPSKLSIEHKRLIEMATQLDNVPDSQLVKLIEKELSKRRA